MSSIVEDGALGKEAMAAAERLARLSGTALSATRALLRDGLNTELGSHLDREADAIAAAAAHRHGRQGIASFVAKRRALFD